MSVSLTLLTRHPNNWHAGQLREAAQRAGLAFNTLTLHGANNLSKQLSDLGSIVYWRGSDLDKLSEQAVLGKMLSNKTVINRALFDSAFLAYKFYQQKMVELFTNVPSVPTYRFTSSAELIDALKDGTLTFPVIAKPNLGHQGKGVLLLKNQAELQQAPIDYPDYIFQSFIENEGDWRVIVVGHKVLGAMKRIARPGSHLNNISQGATAVKETDQAILDQLEKISLTCTQLFGLDLSGLDIIQDRRTGQFHFLEINHIPGWDSEYGFQNVVGVNVADELIQFALTKYGSRKMRVIGHQAIIDFPDQGIFQLPAKIDTGAYYSAIHSQKQRVIDKQGKKVLEFELLDKAHRPGSGRKYEIEHFRNVDIRSSNGQIGHRYRVKLPVIIGGVKVEGEFTLADRSAMSLPVLIGREILKGRFLVEIKDGAA